MKKLKKYLISFGYTLGFIVILTLVLSIFSYFNLLNEKTIKILKIIIAIISIILGGFFIGKNSLEKGYQNGLKFGFMFSCLPFLLSLIFHNLNLSFLFFIVIIIFSSMIGSMIGINKKVTKK